MSTRASTDVYGDETRVDRVESSTENVDKGSKNTDVRRVDTGAVRKILDRQSVVFWSGQAEEAK